MERNKEENAAQEIERPVYLERNGRTDHSRQSTDDILMFSIQAEKRNFDVDIPLIYELTQKVE